MKKFSPSAFFHGRFPIAIVAGLLLALAFPDFGIAGFAWVAPGLILAAALGKNGAEAWRIGYVAGLAHYLGSLYWLLNIPVKGFPILGWVALAAFLALFPATWVWLSLKISSLRRQLPGESWPPILREISKLSWAHRMSWALRCAAIWVALEMILARIFGGFPWNFLGDSQYRILPLIQFASLTGVYGVSFLVAWTSVAFLCAAASILGEPNQRSPWMAEIILPFTAVIAVFVYGFHQLSKPSEAAHQLKVALVQPGIPQTLIWNPDNDLARFQDLLQLSEQALTNQPDLIVWPEAALPGLPRYESQFGNPISALARDHHTWMIIGADDAEATPTATNYFNAAFLIDPDGKLANSYRKRGLVIFGEYIPLERWLPFIKWFTPITGSYTAGDRAVQFELTDASAKVPQKFHTSVLICFEDVFPHLARKSVEPDTDFLVNITNDGWFGEGAAQWQQAAAATFRTVENGVPLIRCANTGITCWIDAKGRWAQKFTDKNGSVYGVGFMIATVPLPDQHSQTFYNRHGDWFGWACLALAIVTVLATWERRRPGGQ
ncbi:MAG TPA: apolipoprotein N-acyltransferase [Verrucomicrobiae bacterium]|nr:apolipoprotein N-acyltransferase [Verrucomicrobiae bacterium]